MEIDKLETFAFAESAAEREAALSQLIPGTEEYYFHTCLNHQLSGALDKVPKVLEAWTTAHGRTGRVKQIEQRQAALQLEDKKDQTLEQLRRDLSLTFHHSRKVEAKSTSYPTRLDQSMISRETFKRQAFSRNSSSLGGFTDRALDWVIDEDKELNKGRVAELLERLPRPDHPKVVNLIVEDLKRHKRESLGNRSIHARLLTKQLDALGEQMPALKKDRTYVNAYLLRLSPNPDVDAKVDPEEHKAHLKRLWSYVKTLAPSFNSLKAHVLYHRLAFDRSHGKYDRKRFLAYLALPRQAHYMRSSYLSSKEHRHHKANLGENYKAYTQLDTVGDDEPLVRDFLLRLLKDEDTPEAFADFIEKRYLDTTFATAKIISGIGDQEAWFKLLSPSEYQTLKERVDVDFAPENPTYFERNEPVTLQVDVKNVKTLVVKLFEINTLNYFLTHKKDVDTSVDLDGLIATFEQTHTFDEPPERRVRRSFTFEALSAPGVYVVELIGGGKSSRALIKKGRLSYLERKSAAGHALTIIDEHNRPAEGATIWLGGRELKPREDGTILIPYTTMPRRAQLLLKQGALTELEHLQHEAERYRFASGLYVDREQLLSKKEAQLMIRPALYLCGSPISLELLSDIELTIETTDRFGVSASKQERDLTLSSREETVVRFSVPEHLEHLSVTITAKVRSVSQQEDVHLSDSLSHQINQIERGGNLEDLFLSHTREGYVLYLLGKTGEPRTDKALTISISHRDFNEVAHMTLQTDADGRIELGALKDINSLTARSPQGVSQTFALSPSFACKRPGAVHAAEGEPILLPYGNDGEDMREFSLLSVRGQQTYVEDHKSALRVQDGFLKVEGLQRGDYALFLKEEQTRILLKVTQAKRVDRWLTNDRRHLEASGRRPLQIVRTEAKEAMLHIKLQHADEDTRVHVLGTRFLPTFSALPALAKLARPPLRSMLRTRGLARYISGRDIGDEYRYILDRRYADRFVGSTLERPGLLLNPWAVRKTSTGINEAAAGGAYSALGMDSGAQPEEPEPEPSPQASEGASFSTLEFLKQEAAVQLNLRPDESGEVRVPLDGLSHISAVRVIAYDHRGYVQRTIALPEVTAEHKDLRLKLALAPDQHYTEKQQVTALDAEEPLEITDITTSSVESFDTLSRAFGLLRTLINAPHGDTLDKFSFVLQWPDKSHDEKCALLSKHACHELHLFIYEKDKSFFEAVVGPYLKNKRHKTFMDHYLLGEDLSGYLEPWRFSRLNAMERALLARRQHKDEIARHLKDRLDLLPPDLDAQGQLFKTALSGSALDGGDALGFAQAQTIATANKAARMDQEKTAFGGLRGGGGKDRKKKSKGAASRSRSALRPKAPPAPAASAGPAMLDELMEEEAEMSKEAYFDDDMDGFADLSSVESRDLASREEQKPFFSQLDKTEEWAENNYYKLRISEQGPELITPSAFWRELAQHIADGEQGRFISTRFTEAHRNFTEALCALAVLDLPFEASKPEVKYDGQTMRMLAKSPLVIFHREIKPADPAEEAAPLLISQHYFREDDRYRFEDNERHDKYVTGELLVHKTVYLCQVVITNPTSSRQRLDLLMQIPQGALPVHNSHVTKGQRLQLQPYSTHTQEYAFYFPAPGTFSHYPVHAAKNEAFVAAAEPQSARGGHRALAGGHDLLGLRLAARERGRGAALSAGAQHRPAGPGRDRMAHEGQGLLRADAEPARGAQGLPGHAVVLRAQAPGHPAAADLPSASGRLSARPGRGFPLAADRHRSGGAPLVRAPGVRPRWSTRARIAWARAQRS